MFLTFSPERDAVISDQHPLGGVEDQRISVFNTLQRPAQFRTQIRRPGIRSINVEPQFAFRTCIKEKVFFIFFLRYQEKKIISEMTAKTHRLVPVQTSCQTHTLLLFPMLGKAGKKK